MKTLTNKNKYLLGIISAISILTISLGLGLGLWLRKNDNTSIRPGTLAGTNFLAPLKSPLNIMTTGIAALNSSNASGDIITGISGNEGNSAVFYTSYNTMTGVLLNPIQFWKWKNTT